MSLIYRSPVPEATSGQHWLYIIAWLALTPFAWWTLHGRLSGGEMRVLLDSPQPDTAQLFFVQGQGGYAEKQSVKRHVKAGENRLHFILPYGPIRRLRLDPVNSGLAASISHIEIRESHERPWLQIPLTKWQPIARTAVNRDNGKLSLLSGATADPQLEYVPPKPLGQNGVLLSGLYRLFLAVMLAGSVVLAGRFWLRLPVQAVERVPAIALALVSGLILAMAVTSTTQHPIHPDEFSHYAAYEYYANHWLPPAVNDPVTIPSCSIWGYSYLYELDVIYDLAAHSTIWLREWIPDGMLVARLFQFALWLALCAFALRQRRWIWPTSVVLLSPQIWYVFAYFNADAFPLVLTIVAAVLVADEDGGLQRYMRTGAWRSFAMWAAAACIGLLVVSKRNFLPVIPALLLWLAVRHLELGARAIATILAGFLALGIAVFIGAVPAMASWQLPMALVGTVLVLGTLGYCAVIFWTDRVKRPVLVRLLGFSLICAAVAVPRLAWDLHINGSPWHKHQLVEAAKEARAGAAFKPSVVATGHGEPSIALAARGVSLVDVTFAPPYNWAHKTLLSAFGVYGYMTIYAPDWVYVVLPLLVLLVAGVAVVGLKRAHPGRWKAYVTIFLGTTILILESSLLLSWTSALEAQGRYLLPIFALIALPLAADDKQVLSRLLGAVVLFASLVGLESFAFVALPALAG